MKSRLSVTIIAFFIALLKANTALSCTVKDANSFSFTSWEYMRDANQRVKIYSEIYHYFNSLHSKIPITTPETKSMLDKIEYFEKFQRVDFKIMEAEEKLRAVKTAFYILKKSTSKSLREGHSYRVIDASLESAILSESISYLTGLDLANSITYMSEIGLLPQPDEQGYHFGCKLIAGSLSRFNTDLSNNIYRNLNSEQGDIIANKKFKYY